MKQIFFILSILFVFTSCNNDDDSAASDVKSTELYKSNDFNGDYNNPTPKSNLVINNLTEWNALLVKLDLNIKPWQNSISTDVDFEKYVVIAVIDELRNSGGHSIDITQITQTDKNIFVKVEQLKTGGISSVMSQPYHIVQIAKTSKKVVFE